MEKNQIQENQYKFPYHYIPHFEKSDILSLSRSLMWGAEYLCYQLHIQDLVISLNPKSVLDVGCGDGYFIGGLPCSIPVRLGVDLSVRAISFAKAFNPSCDFRTTDLSKIKDVFDVVVAIEVLEHVSDDDISLFLNLISDRMAENGSFVISVPTKIIPLNAKHYRHYTLAVLQSQLDVSKCGLYVYDYQYIFKIPWWYPLFIKTMNNSLFFLEVKPVVKFVWQKIWNKYRLADANSGRHLVAVLRKR